MSVFAQGFVPAMIALLGVLAFIAWLFTYLVDDQDAVERGQTHAARWLSGFVFVYVLTIAAVVWMVEHVRLV